MNIFQNLTVPAYYASPTRNDENAFLSKIQKKFYFFLNNYRITSILNHEYNNILLYLLGRTTFAYMVM